MIDLSFGITFPKVYNVYFLAIISTMGGMLFGFDISSMSAIVGTDQYINYFNNPAGAYQGAIGSALAAGSIIGCLFAGWLSDKFGRRDACQICKSFFQVGDRRDCALSSNGSSGSSDTRRQFIERRLKNLEETH